MRQTLSSHRYSHDESTFNFQLIREALMNLDNQIFNFETLNSIYAIRPQEDEIRCTQDYLKNATAGSTSAEENRDKSELLDPHILPRLQ